ncbi:hypothetical protein ACOMHN_062829 [Nucella lapillus]
MMDFSSFSSLRRYENLEDMTQAGTVWQDEEEARIYKVATEAAGAAIAAAIQEHQRLAKLEEDENGNPPSPNEDAPFPSCTSQAQPAATASANPVSTSSSISSTSKTSTSSSGGGAQGGGPEEEARSQRKALEAHISDEINKITQGMQDIVRRGAADIKPIPPPKPRRRLPDPTVGELSAGASLGSEAMTTCGPATSSPSVSPSLRRARAGKGVRIAENAEDIPQHVALPSRSIGAKSGEAKHHPHHHHEGATASTAGATAAAPAGTSDSESPGMPRQDSAEKKKAKDLKAKPSPLLIQHIEAEEQSVSPHYRVMDSPPTPEHKLIKREFSESTSVSPSSSPDNDQYMFPSPVTPPDSDSSPPKPHSPSSPGTDLDEDTLQYSAATGDLSLTSDISLGMGHPGVTTFDPDIALMTFDHKPTAYDAKPAYEPKPTPAYEPKAVSTEAKPTASTYDQFSQQTVLAQPEAPVVRIHGKRVPPPVPVRSKASGAGGGGMEGPRALPPPPVRSESLDSEGSLNEEGEASASVRDKIRAFEQ